eukprot:4827629-Lingulodinium_polyedra.AAC.1
MVVAKVHGEQQQTSFLFGSGAAVLCKPVPACIRTRAGRVPLSDKAKMAMWTAVLFSASRMSPLAEVWGARRVRVSHRLSSNTVSPCAP